MATLTPEEQLALARQIADHSRTKRTALREWLAIIASLFVISAGVYAFFVWVDGGSDSPAIAVRDAGSFSLKESFKDLKASNDRTNETLIQIRESLSGMHSELRANRRRIDRIESRLEQ